MADSTEPERERFLHERLAGCGARALAVTLGMSPVSLVGLVAGDGVDLLLLHLVALVGPVPVFLLERRDDPRWRQVLARAALGGLLGALLAAMCVLWVSDLRPGADPGAASGRFLEGLARALPGILGVGFAVAISAPLWALPLLVRACTVRAAPLIAAGTLVAAVGVTPWFALAPDPESQVLLRCVAAVAAGALASALVAAAEDRLCVQGDPAAPAPEESDPTRRFAVFGLSAFVLVLVIVPPLLSAGVRVNPRRRGATGARSSLQTLRIVQDYDVMSARDAAPAGNLGDLPLHDELSSGVKDGYVFRLSRPAGRAGQRSWAAAADPASPGAGEWRFWIDQDGQLLAAPVEAPPAPLDPRRPPDGWEPAQ